MRIAEALTLLGYEPGVDFVARDDGAGPYLDEWLSSDPEPDQAAIDAALVQVQLAEAEAAYGRAVQAHLDATARERQYDSVQTAVTYRDDPNPQYAAEAAALFQWRSDVWTYVEQVQADVQAGTRTQPTVAGLIAELPAFAWP